MTVTRLPTSQAQNESDDPYELLAAASAQVEEMTARLRQAPRTLTRAMEEQSRIVADALEALDVASAAIVTAHAAVHTALFVAQAQKERADQERERSDRILLHAGAWMRERSADAEAAVPGAPEVHSYP